MFRENSQVDPLDMDQYLDSDIFGTTSTSCTTNQAARSSNAKIGSETASMSICPIPGTQSMTSHGQQQPQQQIFAGPSHQYDQYRQHTSLPIGAVANTLAFNESESFGNSTSGVPSPWALGFNSSDLQIDSMAMPDEWYNFSSMPTATADRLSANESTLAGCLAAGGNTSAMDLDVDLDFSPAVQQQALMHVFPSPAHQRLSAGRAGDVQLSSQATNSARLSDTASLPVPASTTATTSRSSPFRAWPGMHQQQAAMQAKAQAEAFAQRQAQNQARAQSSAASAQHQAYQQGQRHPKAINRGNMPKVEARGSLDSVLPISAIPSPEFSHMVKIRENDQKSECDRNRTKSDTGKGKGKEDTSRFPASTATNIKGHNDLLNAADSVDLDVRALDKIYKANGHSQRMKIASLLPSSAITALQKSEPDPDDHDESFAMEGLDKFDASDKVENLGKLASAGDMNTNDDDIDDDARLLASEEGKKLTSKERRQLRNKVSARAFRSRRKEYIGQLEGELAAKSLEAENLQTRNDSLVAENTRLTDLTRMLLSSSHFSTFLSELSSKGRDDSVDSSDSTHDTMRQNSAKADSLQQGISANSSQSRNDDQQKCHHRSGTGSSTRHQHERDFGHGKRNDQDSMKCGAVRETSLHDCHHRLGTMVS